MYKIIQLTKCDDKSGKLISCESFKNVPFDIKRVYCIYNTDSRFSRGFHAHKSLSQLIFAVNGAVDFTLDDGVNRETITLDDPSKCLLLEGVVWREMHNFRNNCVLNILCNDYYDDLDYIRDYDMFLKIVGNGE